MLYPKPESLGLLYKNLQINSMMLGSSLPYRLLKKLISLIFAQNNNNQQQYDILQGFQMFSCYYTGTTVKNKYQIEDIKTAVEEVHGVKGKEKGK